MTKKRKKMRISKGKLMKDNGATGIGEPSIYHALIVIFLEFFAWGLLTNPMLTVLDDTFKEHTFLMNGLVQGVKGILSFLSAPLLGALSDVWGRKSFLLLTVFFTCMPIPLMRVSAWWFFAMLSVSGTFAVTFSIIFAYVADITDESERSSAYGLVSATFAASLITSPALGTYLGNVYGDNVVVFLATAVALCDVLFILVAVPESLPEKVRPASWGAAISWEQADPFNSLRKVGQDFTVLMLCIAVFLSYLPEAGQYSCIFLYLRIVGQFTEQQVPAYIAVVGVLSVLTQTILLGILIRTMGHKHTIMLALVCEMLELMWYGFASHQWMMWVAGIIASVCSINYPAISALVSRSSSADKQGVVQGMITGIRGLCNGLGPCLFGVIFYFFDVNLDIKSKEDTGKGNDTAPNSHSVMPGPPFVFGAFLVIVALLFAYFIQSSDSGSRSSDPAHSSQLSPRSVEGSKPLLADVETGHGGNVTLVDEDNP
ncbi:hippocampus abundant transcript 1 protein-like [Patiria miniata]|uniref:Major facilitator superfamily (MFS) profile domain-containing protein n=1 Tax=Patiria miniata TaxID=46514 RepID=A0A914AUR3_PATMI|nr:hippocampus abundant transcript 1 protein-like [Patiria miniata]